jgi:hypothetical protein
MPELREIATTLRSKNADPFITTCDVFIREASDYRWLKQSQLLTREHIAELYRMPVKAVIGIYFVDNIQAVKISFFKTHKGRYIASGDLEDLDLVGAQQHIPLLRMAIPDANLRVTG